MPILELNLEHKSLSPLSAEFVSNLINENKDIEKLSLFSNYISDDGVEQLFPTLSTHTGIRSIILSFNSIGDKGAFYLSRLLRIKRLYTLELDENDIGIEGIESLLEALESNHRIIQMSLYGNPGFGLGQKTRLRQLLDRNWIRYRQETEKAAIFVQACRKLLVLSCSWDIKINILRQVQLDITGQEFWMLVNVLCTKETIGKLNTDTKFTIEELLRQCKVLRQEQPLNDIDHNLLQPSKLLFTNSWVSTMNRITSSVVESVCEDIGTAYFDAVSRSRSVTDAFHFMPIVTIPTVAEFTNAFQSIPITMPTVSGVTNALYSIPITLPSASGLTKALPSMPVYDLTQYSKRFHDIKLLNVSGLKAFSMAIPNVSELYAMAIPNISELIEMLSDTSGFHDAQIGEYVLEYYELSVDESV